MFLEPFAFALRSVGNRSTAEDLPRRTRLGLRAHLWMCIWCRRNAGQLQLIRDLTRCATHVHDEDVRLSSAARDRIADCLCQENQGSSNS